MYNAAIKLKSKTLPKIGVDEFWFAKLLKDEVGEDPEYDPSVKVPGTVQVGFNPNSQTGTFYADNIAYAVAAQLGDLALTVGLADIPPELSAIWFGHEYENGLLEEGQIDPIDMAVAYRVKKSNNAHRYVWLYKSKAAPPAESVDTKTNTINFQSGSAVISAAVLVSKNKFRRILDDDDPNLSEGVTPALIFENWFKSPLWMPGAETAPDPDPELPEG